VDSRSTGFGQSGAAQGAVLLVDPVITGHPFKAACRARGLAVISLYTITEDVLSELAADHAIDDDVTLYAADPDEAHALIESLSWPIRTVVPATEPAVYVADLLAAKLGLPGNDPGTALARRDKAVMRRLAVSAGIRVPAFEVVDELPHVRAAAERIGYPLILKPTTGASSRDVRLVPRPGELEAAITASGTVDLFGAPVRDWLVERYIRGREFAVNAFSLNGRHRILDVWEYRQPDDADYDQPYWDLVQVPHDDPFWGPVTAFTQQVLEVFGVGVGPSHTEVKCDGDGVHLIEIGGRLPGARITDHWVGHCSFRPYDETLSALLGELLELPEPEFDAALGICCLRNDGAAGTLRAIHGLEELRSMPGVDDIHLTYTPGEHVPLTRDLDTVVAKVLVSGADRDSVLNTLETVRHSVKLEVV
jgi:biotin carboxylase